MLAALVFSVTHVVLVAWLEAGEISVQTGKTLTFDYLVGKLLMSYTLSDIIKYWIVVLGHLGWHYYKAYRERELQASALATELVRARLETLRMQINPHFLFNTLNSVSSLVRFDPDTAREYHDETLPGASNWIDAAWPYGEQKRVQIADEKFLLPVLSDAKFTSAEAGKLFQSRNLIRFKNYQRYGTEVKILDDDVKIEPEQKQP